VANGEQTNRRMLVTEVRHSDFAPRADDADGARELGSDSVPLITKYCTTPCGISPVVTMRHNPMSSLRASATTIFVLRAPVSTLPKDMKTCRKAHSVLMIGNSHIFRISALGRHGKGARREGARSLIAQLVEQSTVNRAVASSSPAQAAKSRR
jgi:hypothetical protein